MTSPKDPRSIPVPEQDTKRSSQASFPVGPRLAGVTSLIDQDEDLHSDELIVQDAIRRLTEAGFPPSRPNWLHLRYGRVNFYPVTGTMNLDNQPKIQARGVDAAIAFIRRSISKTPKYPKRR